VSGLQNSHQLLPIKMAKALLFYTGADMNEGIISLISAKKNEPDWMLEWRLKSYRCWVTMKEPTWANIHYPPIDYQAITYYSAPKSNGQAQEHRRRGS
jgi:hypothetical protein